MQELLNGSKAINGSKMGRGCLALGLTDLIKDKIIKKEEATKRYFIKTKIENKTILASQKQKNDIMNLDLDICMKELEENETRFELGYGLLRSAMYYLSKLTLERHSPKLTNLEKVECDRLIKRCNDTIERTFDVLYDKNFEQASALKKGLDTAITNPGYEFKMFKSATNRQQRRALKIPPKISKHVIKNFSYNKDRVFSQPNCKKSQKTPATKQSTILFDVKFGIGRED